MNTPVVVPSQFLTASLTLGLIVVAALQTALVGGVTTVEALQLAALLVGGIVTYFAKILPSGWQPALKVGGAVLGAVLVAIIGVIDSVNNGGPVWTAETITLVFFAGLNALAAQFGVDKRVAENREALADPAVLNAIVQAKDPSGVQAASVTVNHVRGG